MNVMMTFSWIGVMLLVGMVCRAKIPLLSNILMPASVIGGIIGFILMNLGILTKLGADAAMCSEIVGFFFTLSFISIGLTGLPNEEGKSSDDTAKQVLKGSIGMGLLWDILYGLTPLIGFIVILLVGTPFGMDAKYGLMIPFAFCQGPGQSATFGAQIEAGGVMEGAAQVAITYAVIGFLFAFLVGVPLAKIGLKKNLVSHPEKISPAVLKGLYPPEQQTESCGKITTYNGSVDVLAFHVALVGLCYVIAIFIQDLIQAVPNTFIQTMGSMTFFIGLFVAYGVKWVMGKLNLKQYHDDALQARITGFTTDYVILGAFMAVQLSIIGKWLIPIIVMCVVVGIVTLGFALFFGSRLGGTCDFERTLGLWGCLTGTCPSGVALIRIVDPSLRTTAATEMGSMNIIMVFDYLIAPAIIEFCLGHLSATMLLIYCLGTSIICMIALVLTKNFNKPTYSFRAPVVCPDVSDDCEYFEDTKHPSQF